MRNYVIKSCFLFLALPILLFQEVKAQKTYQDGYVLISEFDTIYGKIENKDYYQNSRYCDFINTNSTQVTRYYPDKIYGYRFSDGKFYISKNIEIENTKRTVFMEYLIKGKLDIYYTQDEGFTPHYFASKDSLALQELKYNEGVKVVDGIDVFYKQKQYSGILNYLTSDCPVMKNKISEIEEPNQEKLIRFAKKYHDLTCPDKECTIYSKKIPRKIRIYSYAGPQLFLLDDYYPSDIDILKGEIFPSYGFNIMVQQAQRFENIYLGIGFIYVPHIDSANNFYRIPLSLTYLNVKNGFSPIFSFEFDINRMFSQSLIAGLRFQTKRLAFTLDARLNTLLFIKPYGASMNFGMMYNLR